jgi:hypothetical protein
MLAGIQRAAAVLRSCQISTALIWNLSKQLWNLSKQIPTDSSR